MPNVVLPEAVELRHGVASQTEFSLMPFSREKQNVCARDGVETVIRRAVEDGLSRPQVPEMPSHFCPHSRTSRRGPSVPTS